jgi:hypothetical protein
MDKKIKEITTSAAVAGFSAPIGDIKKKLKEKTVPGAFSGTGTISVDTTAVKSGKKDRPWKRTPEPKKVNPRAVKAKLPEEALREAIKELIFLNKIKFYEEQTKEAIQENKLRYIIRKLLLEKANEITYSTTGQNFGADALDNTKLAQKKYESLSSSQNQRASFEKHYMDAIKNTLESLDQQDALFAAPLAVTTPNVAAPAAKRGDVEEAEGDAPAPAPTNPDEQENLKKQAIEKTVQQTITKLDQSANKADDKTGYDAAKAAAQRDIPQIASLYTQLSNEKKTVTEPDGKSRETTDREDFKRMLLGNLELKFRSIDKLTPTSDTVASAPQAPVSPTTPEVASQEAPSEEAVPEETGKE